MIYTTLTLNSTTLYTYENFLLIQKVNNLNCSEILSQELGLINVSKTLVGSMSVSTSPLVTNSSLLLYFMKKTMVNQDGSSDLLTVVALASVNVNKMLALSVLKKIMDKYISFKHDIEKEASTTPGGSSSDQIKAKLGKFKPYMSQIIKFEEMNYDANNLAYRYGAINSEGHDEESDTLFDAQVINPNQLLLASEEVEDVRQLMLDNINKIMNRGDKISSLVDQTDRLNNSSLVFTKKAQLIKRKMWVSKIKFTLIVGTLVAFLLYLLVGSQCGFPFFNHCIH